MIIIKILGAMAFLFLALCIIWGVDIPFVSITPLLLIGAAVLMVLSVTYAVSIAASMFVDAPNIAREMHASGHDGKPRNWILRDGTVYSGMFFTRAPDGREIKIVDITPAKVERIEYP